MYSRWVYDGAIEDPFFEFFVKVNADISDDSDHAWREKHVLDPKLVPNCVPLDTARTILLVGKSVYFIRQRCGDSAEIVPQEVREGGIEMFKYGQPGGLQSALDQAYSITGARLLDIMHNKFRLSVHMVALKKYLLLAQGDFVQALMENVDRELSCPAEKLYLHNLASTIQTAAQATTVKYEDAEVLERLDVRLEQVGREASTGYDLFLLDYHVHGPVNVVFTGTAMHQYHRLVGVYVESTGYAYL
ncbi:hypothetical protein SARC_09496 [Sphaeroforma arctica JP610]|uniref:Uncharacterized protein n=1 Tax=Sphaeroforma arctica JP610 TaxID=667725 RepID=A0A0L0FMU7_9EUKA|nr:hypothetical protein SARC_09496 [Sphaeroforma arctica JP610]KNC78062.1 hypothetical protein SARC_09496 [Sphaeroforma arctica JP610]|eukprot:XP_014151964.1 hypothetical protein SARC_09496 [Sphaeroforma arctica JP610]